MATRNVGGQRGAALIVALVFLVMLTLLGLAAMGTNRAQQRETYAVSEQTLAFQAAETGLVDGENWIENQLSRPVPDCPLNCSKSTSVIDATMSAGTPVLFEKLKLASWWQTEGRLYGHTYKPGAAIVSIPAIIPEPPPGQPPDVSEEDRLPRYVIEHLGKDPTASLVPGAPAYTLWYYRVTARGTGVQPDPPAIVQSVYVKGY